MRLIAALLALAACGDVLPPPMSDGVCVDVTPRTFIGHESVGPTRECAWHLSVWECYAQYSSFGTSIWRCTIVGSLPPPIS